MATAVYGLTNPVIQVASGRINNGLQGGGHNYGATPITSSLTCISFSPPFGGRPSVIVTAVDNNRSANATVVCVLPDKCLVSTSRDSANTSISFFFTAFGPQGSARITDYRAVVVGSFDANHNWRTSAANWLNLTSPGVGINRFTFASGSNWISDYAVVSVSNPCTVAWEYVYSTNSNSIVANNVASTFFDIITTTNWTSTAGNVGGEFLLIGKIGSSFTPPTPARFLFGSTTAQGDVKSGNGFGIVPRLLSSGVFDVVPYTNYNSNPVLLLSINYPGTDSYTINPWPTPSNPKDNVIALTSSSVGTMEFKTGDSNFNGNAKCVELLLVSMF